MQGVFNGTFEFSVTGQTMGMRYSLNCWICTGQYGVQTEMNTGFIMGVVQYK
jgi:hypothetical protein